MINYIIRRVLQTIPLLLGIAGIGFVLIRLTGDPLSAYMASPYVTPEDLARLTEHYGLDKPVWYQFFLWLKNMITGDWGTSYVTGERVVAMMAQRLPNTMILAGASYAVILVAGVSLGVYSALNQYRVSDHLITGLTFVGMSMPSFWLGLVLMGLFAVNFRHWGLPYLPTGGMYELSVGKTLPQVLWHLVLPVATYAIVVTAHYVRYVRASMLEVIRQDYLRTARAKGLSEKTVIWKHAFKNAAVPVVTLMGLDFPRFMSGALVIEYIFAWPGMGRLFWQHAQNGDIPVLMIVLMFTSAMVVVFGLLADIVYAFIDPRIRYS